MFAAFGLVLRVLVGSFDGINPGMVDIGRFTEAWSNVTRQTLDPQGLNASKLPTVDCLAPFHATLRTSQRSAPLLSVTLFNGKG